MNAKARADRPTTVLSVRGQARTVPVMYELPLDASRDAMKTRSRWLASFGVAGMLVMAGCVDPLGMDDAGNTQTLRVATRPPRAELLGARIDGDWVVAGSERIGWVADGSGLRGATAPRRASDGPRAAPSIDSGVICWYLITFVTTTGEIVSVKFLGCTSGGGGTQCDEEQRRIADEYRNAGWVFGRKAPACDDIEENGSGTAHFSWAELNGWFQEGNPHTGYGWVQQSLKTSIRGSAGEMGPVRATDCQGLFSGPRVDQRIPVPTRQRVGPRRIDKLLSHGRQSGGYLDQNDYWPGWSTLPLG